MTIVFTLKGKVEQFTAVIALTPPITSSLWLQNKMRSGWASAVYHLVLHTVPGLNSMF